MLVLLPMLLAVLLSMSCRRGRHRCNLPAAVVAGVVAVMVVSRRALLEADLLLGQGRLMEAGNFGAALVPEAGHFGAALVAGWSAVEVLEAAQPVEVGRSCYTGQTSAVALLVGPSDASRKTPELPDGQQCNMRYKLTIIYTTL